MSPRGSITQEKDRSLLSCRELDNVGQEMRIQVKLYSSAGDREKPRQPTASCSGQRHSMTGGSIQTLAFSSSCWMAFGERLLLITL